MRGACDLAVGVFGSLGGGMMCKYWKQKIIPPDGGWKENSWYVVNVAYASNNPIHRALFYTGFLNNGKPSGYNYLCAINGRDNEYNDISSVKYLRAVRYLFSTKELDKHEDRIDAIELGRTPDYLNMEF